MIENKFCSKPLIVMKLVAFLKVLKVKYGLLIRDGGVYVKILMLIRLADKNGFVGSKFEKPR